jgi:hypothetical protein
METETMIEDKPHLDEWYRSAANAPCFIGFALKRQRGKEFLMQEQQRNLLGILDKKYDQLWLRLQAMPMPRVTRPDEDLREIVTSVISDVGVDATIDIERLKEMIQAGSK